MSLRIWLNTKGTKAVKTEKKTRDDNSEHEDHHLGDLEIKTDHRGRGMFAHFYHTDPTNPVHSMPIIDRKFVKRVTYTGKYFEGLRADGIYRHKGATAHLQTVEKSEGFGDRVFNRRYQEISIVAGSIRTLREIYTKVRSGELEAEEDWGVHKDDIKERAEGEDTDSAEAAVSQ